MPPADDDFDIYGEDDGFGSVKVEEVSAAPRPRVRRLALPLHAVLPPHSLSPSWSSSPFRPERARASEANAASLRRL